MGGDTGSHHVLAQCIHHPGGNSITFTKKPQVLKLTSEGTILFGGHTDRIGATSQISINDIQNTRFTLHKPRSFVSDVKIAMLAILGNLTAIIAMWTIAEVPPPLFVTPIFGIFLLAIINKIVSRIDPPQTLIIQTNDSELNIYNKGHWSGFFQRLSNLLFLFYPLLIVTAVVDIIFGGFSDWANIAGPPLGICILGTFYIFIYELIHLKSGTGQDDFQQFCYIVDSQHRLQKNPPSDENIAEGKKNLHPEIEMLKLLFDKHRAELQSIKIQIETLSLNPAASVSIQQIGIATERMFKLACELEGGKPGKPPTLTNYIQWLRKNARLSDHVYEASIQILIFRNFVMHNEDQQSEVALPALLQNFNQILEWYTKNYLESEQE
jgi:hypothetical protein